MCLEYKWTDRNTLTRMTRDYFPALFSKEGERTMKTSTRIDSLSIHEWTLMKKKKRKKKKGDSLSQN